MAREKDAFSNPVGHTFSRVLDALLDQLIEEKTSEEDLRVLVDDVMRVRAVQAFTPSKAVGFFFMLKPVVREVLEVSKLDRAQWASLLEFESTIDRVVLQAFEAYLGCREKLYEIKATELRRRSERVIQKLNERLLAKAQERERSEGGDR